MTEYDNTNRGTLFKNERKEGVAHADYEGSINVDGVEFWLNAWIKTSNKTSKKFMSLSVKPKGQVSSQVSKSSAPKQNDFDDECPF